MKIGKTIYMSIAIGIFGCQANINDLRYKKNYLKGIELSKKMGKPIFLYFTCYGCMGYNEFYEDLITSKEIQNKLNEEFITIQLYVDDRKEIQEIDTLNLHKIGFTEEGIKRINNSKTIGQINSAIENDLFKHNSQPLYVIVDSKMNILVEPFGYTQRNRKYFIEKLDEGLKGFSNSF